MEIVKKELSPEAKVEVNLTGGKIVLTAVLDTKGLDGNLTLSVETDYFFDELAARIPGKVDDAVIGMLKQAVKSL